MASSLKKIDNRESNIELLRILSMLAIIVYHSCWHIRDCFDETGGLFSEALCSITIFHVTLFVLISGYFSIKLSWSSFLKVVTPCVVISLLFVCAELITFNKTYQFRDLIKLFLPPPTSKWWFASVYIQLMLFSPLLNELNRKISLDKHFLFVCLYSPFILLDLWGHLSRPIRCEWENYFSFYSGI
ncbi:MAG: acyltransferase family protein [Bacteroides sp.]|nr:acyltransferase family protein [Bacteroides sp.]